MALAWLAEDTPRWDADKERIVAGSFVLGGLVLIGVSLAITQWTVLLASFAEYDVV